MDNLMKQIREKFTGAEEERADQIGSRDHKIPIQKTQPFKEKKKGPSWFQRQLSRKMSHDYDADAAEIEHAAAVAAAAFAINSLEIPESPESRMQKSKSKTDDSKSPIAQLRSASKRLSGSFRLRDDQGDNVPMTTAADEKKPEKAFTPASSMKKPSFTSTDEKKPEKPPSIRKTSFSEHLTNSEDKKLDGFETPSPVQPVSLGPPPPPPPPLVGIDRQPSTQPQPLKSPPAPGRPPSTRRVISGGTRAEAWERAELERIKERYENLHETIDSWERKKRTKAKKKLEKGESEHERQRAKALEKYRNELQYIDQIAGGARAQAAERQRNEVHKAKEKANIIRTTGKVPSTCPCF